MLQGFNLHFKAEDDKTLRLRDWDDWLYGNLVIFASGIQGRYPMPASLAVLHSCCYAALQMNAPHR